MNLWIYKFSIAIVIAIITLLSGIASLRLVRRYQYLLSLTDAFADGIFLGLAIFHLFPESAIGLKDFLSPMTAYLSSLTMIGISFSFLFGINTYLEKRLSHLTASSKKYTHTQVSILVLALSIHAFTAGAALGISQNILTISILLIAILAHKGFESFALSINLYRTLRDERKTRLILWTFTFVTPIGIILSASIDTLLHAQAADLFVNLFNAFAAGTFLYIAICHHKYTDITTKDPVKHYQKIIATLIGVCLMALLGLYL